VSLYWLSFTVSATIKLIVLQYVILQNVVAPRTVWWLQGANALAYFAEEKNTVFFQLQKQKSITDKLKENSSKRINEVRVRSPSNESATGKAKNRSDAPFPGTGNASGEINYLWNGD
jgi:hypothetical protein